MITLADVDRYSLEEIYDLLEILAVDAENKARLNPNGDGY
jgi:hypothetical protein